MTTSAANGAVVVGVDATTHSDAALEWATRYATAHHRPLLLVHAAGVPTVYESLSGPTENRRELRIAGRRTTDRALGLVRQQAPELEVRVHMALGIARDVLLDSIEGAHLLVVGSRGRGSLASFVLGSVSVGMAAKAPCPVVVVRPIMARHEDSPYFGSVVVGVDATDLSQAALEQAFDLASTEGRALVVMHAWGPGLVMYHQPPEIETFAGEEHHLALAEALAGYAERYPDVAVTEYHTQQEPGRELVRISEDAYLVVVGSRGRSEARSVIFGSVSRYVVEHARCPVMVVRRPAPVAAVTSA
ncbi:universal stress protein [Nocardioides mesophilus]|uniref:Universal stress protein n=1 Tax=Nocardioides mesophilus TaxID=433659 RepID=A0A7G9R6G4_9ACTN|nr:universal stress protein [Nocardioides mesophilus]QNN51189.1 universal stress protein [Nocardioides mesophilus]